jgi:phage recombination protein Bet
MTKALATTSPAPPQPSAEFTREQVELIKRTVAKGATDDELQLFLGLCRRTGLDPFARQIYGIKRWDSRKKREVMQAQASIDGFRLIADRSGRYEGQLGPFWCGRDGEWVDVWVPNEPPVAAKVGVLKAGCREPFWSVAKYAEYMQTDRDGKPVSMWRKMPANQLAKCSEALSLRKAFPQEISGLYAPEEMGQAGIDQPVPAASPKVAEIPAAAPSDDPADAEQTAPPEPEDEPAAASIKQRLEQFARIREAMGDAGYYAILNAHGFAHANEVKQLSAARAIYREMREALDHQTTRGVV